MTPTPNEIMKLRNGKNLTQRKSAELLGVSRRKWVHWEYGETPMPEDMWEKYQNIVI